MSFYVSFAVAVAVILLLVILRRIRRKANKRIQDVQGSFLTKIKLLVFLPFLLKRQRRMRAIAKAEEKSSIFRPSTRMGVGSIWAEFFGSGKSRIRLPPGAKPKNIQDLHGKLKLHSGDVMIAAYPKSGTTWTQNIVKLIQNRGVEDGKDLEEVSPWVDMMTLEEVEAMKLPRSFKTHMPFALKFGGDLENSPAKYIYTYRNPKDTAVSFFHFFFVGYFPLMDWNTFVENYLTGSLMYGSVLDHVMGWWQQQGAPNLLILCYEEMHKDPKKQIQRIAEFLDVDLTPEIVDSIAEQTLFKNMKKNPASNMHWTDRFREDKDGKFMRKGKVGDWRNHFTEEQSTRMDTWIAEQIPSDCGLTFDFGDE